MKIRILIGSIVLICFGFESQSAAALGEFDNLSPKIQSAVRKYHRTSGGNMTLDGVAKIFKDVLDKGMDAVQLRPILEDKEKKIASIKRKIDITFLEESLRSSGMDPKLLRETLADHYEDFEMGDDGNRKGMAWQIVASYKNVNLRRSFDQLEELKVDLLSKAHEKGVAPHTFGEWFDRLPAGDVTVKAIHLLTKVMGLSDAVATEAVRSGLSYDDYESIVDAGAESADPESSVREKIHRYVSGLGASSGACAAASAAAASSASSRQDTSAADSDTDGAARAMPAAFTPAAASKPAAGRRARGGRGRSFPTSTGRPTRRPASEKDAAAAAASYKSFSVKKGKGDFLGENPMRKGKGDE